MSRESLSNEKVARAGLPARDLWREQGGWWAVTASRAVTQLDFRAITLSTGFLFACLPFTHPNGTIRRAASFLFLPATTAISEFVESE